MSRSVFAFVPDKELILLVPRDKPKTPLAKAHKFKPKDSANISTMPSSSLPNQIPCTADLRDGSHSLSSWSRIPNSHVIYLQSEIKELTFESTADSPSQTNKSKQERLICLLSQALAILDDDDF